MISFKHSKNGKTNSNYALILFLAFWIAAVLNAQTATIFGQVVGVHDCDTLILLTSEREQIKVRLQGIDAPELKQPFGNASKQSLSDLVFGKSVKLEVTGTDRYRRTLVNVYAENRWVNLVQVEKGFAWRYVKYSTDPRLIESEAGARKERVGLWSDLTPIPPWEWRLSKKKKATP